MKKYISILFLCSLSFTIIGSPNYQTVVMQNDTNCHKTTDGKFKWSSKSYWVSSYTSPFGESISLFGPYSEGKVAILSGTYAILDKGDSADEYNVAYTSGDKYIISHDVKPGDSPFLFMRYDPCSTLRMYLNQKSGDKIK